MTKEIDFQNELSECVSRLRKKYRLSHKEVVCLMELWLLMYQENLEG